MIAPSSRYAQGEAMWVSTQDPDVGRGNKQTVYLNTVIYLTNPYSVALVRETDDMTMFAFTAYGDPRRWWVHPPRVLHGIDTDADDGPHRG
jgi:hypothetical protein